MRRIHRWPVNSRHKGPVTQKMLPFDDIIMMLWAVPKKLAFQNTLSHNIPIHLHIDCLIWYYGSITYPYHVWNITKQYELFQISSDAWNCQVNPLLTPGTCPLPPLTPRILEGASFWSCNLRVCWYSYVWYWLYYSWWNSWIPGSKQP